MVTPKQMENLLYFFECNPTGTLDKKTVNEGVDTSKITDDDYESHSVCIVGISDGALLCKNTWGKNFADGGFFRIAENAVEF